MVDLISCKDCGQCNHRGKPSVSRYSAYCDSHKKFGIQINRSGLYQRFKDFLFNRRFDEKEKKVNPKGFRPSWFWR